MPKLQNDYRIHSNRSVLGVNKTRSWCINDGLKILPQIHAFSIPKLSISPIFGSQELDDKGVGRLFEHGHVLECIR